MNRLTTLLFLNLLFSQFVLAQTPEPQISFAQEFKSTGYYVEQAELWWAELEKDSSSENNWYNYFRACRNTEGSNDWKSDFIKLSPALRGGQEIVQRIKNNVPNTFTYYYTSYLTNGIGTENYQNLLKAYELNPNFPGIHSSLISYAESNNDIEFRQKVNREWIKTNYLSYQLLNYSYNVLISLDSNAILFTQSDNDTYPTWMIQDAKGIRTDVQVINIDFLLLDDYRKTLFEELNVPPMDLGEVDIDEYHLNWEKVVAHVINSYNGNRPVYLGMTLFDHIYEDFKNQLYISGLAYRYSELRLSTEKQNIKLFEESFRLDYLKDPLTVDRNQMNINYQNTNYIRCFINIYKQYLSAQRISEAEELKELSLLISSRINNESYYDRVKEAFGE